MFDSNTITIYSAYGACNYYTILTSCGEKTGLYLSLARGTSLLVAFRYYFAASASSLIDPMTVTIEGSNQVASALLSGSSWTLIYSGSSGLDYIGLGQSGTEQWLFNNTIWYSSYRILVTSKRGVGNLVSYSELQLLGY